MRRPAGRSLATAAVLALALVAGCRPGAHVVSVKTLLDDPSQFDGKIVRVAGDVTESLSIMGYGAYRIDDGTGTITVVTKEDGAPRKGAHVGVEGEFRTAFTLGSETLAVVMEKDRRLEPGK